MNQETCLLVTLTDANNYTACVQFDNNNTGLASEISWGTPLGTACADIDASLSCTGGNVVSTMACPAGCTYKAQGAAGTGTAPSCSVNNVLTPGDADCDDEGSSTAAVTVTCGAGLCN